MINVGKNRSNKEEILINVTTYKMLIYTMGNKTSRLGQLIRLVFLRFSPSLPFYFL
jgi:hypothetical protein